jgi:hypothetical protein
MGIFWNIHQISAKLASNIRQDENMIEYNTINKNEVCNLLYFDY